jgi:hypothetical protein
MAGKKPVNALSQLTKSPLVGGVKPHENYGIDKHFQYHLINYNEPTAYAALTP